MRLITDTAIVGHPVVARNYLFWLDGRHLNRAIYGYNLKTEQEFLIPAQHRPRFVASDGTIVAWIEQRDSAFSSYELIRGYDLRTKHIFTFVTATSAAGFGTLAMHNGQLYYTRRDQDQRGLYVYTVATGQIQQIGPGKAEEPVVDDSFLLWNHENPRERYATPSRSLYLRQLENGAGTTMLTGTRNLISYAVDGKYAVWSHTSTTGTQQVVLYDIDRQEHKIISMDMAEYPVIAGDVIAWVNRQDDLDTSTLSVYNSNTGFTDDLVVASSPVRIRPWGFTEQNELVFTVTRATGSGLSELYVSNLQTRGMHFTSQFPSESANHETEQLSTDQIFKDGSFFYDRLPATPENRWALQGVQFHIPEHGINSWQFISNRYGPLRSPGQASPTPEERERAFWMQRASSYLGANTLRVFTSVPGSAEYESPDPSIQPIEVETIYDFAREAEQYDLRLGLVVNNGNNFEMTTERRDWLRELITLFHENDALHLIAYISADNEINNHPYNPPEPGRCQGSEDCYAYDEYAISANNWVHDVRNVIRGVSNELGATPPLITVGLSSERTIPETEETISTETMVDHFFRQYTDGGGNLLAASLDSGIDFISTHRYGEVDDSFFSTFGNKYAYIESIVLEEFGWPTDPLNNEGQPASPNWQEGPAICREDPFNAACFSDAPPFLDTASHIVEVLIEHQRRNTYAGGTAFMLTDMAQKDRVGGCGTSPEDGFTFDLFTGLFAIGGEYCDGTTTTQRGFPKATASRVCLYYHEDDPSFDVNRCTRVPSAEGVYLPLVRR